MPVPKPGTPEGEELARTLIEAGYLKSTMPQVFQVFRFGMGLFPLVLFVLPATLLVIVGPALIQILRTLGGS